MTQLDRQRRQTKTTLRVNSMIINKLNLLSSFVYGGNKRARGAKSMSNELVGFQLVNSMLQS